MYLGMIIARAGGLDGVALEASKWLKVLRGMGHRCAVLAGEFEDELENETLCPELALDHPATVWAQEIAFFGEPYDESAFIAELEAQAEALAAEIEAWVRRENFDALIIENASALPRHIQLGMALEKVIPKLRVPTVCHDHNFAWEGGDRFITPLPQLAMVLARCFPLVAPNVKHVVINHAACDALWQRGIAAMIVPNVVDFNTPFGQPDEFNATLRSDLGLKASDKVLFQISRIVRRKSIETAVELCYRLNDPQVKLVIAGTSRSERQDEYMAELCAQVGRLRLGERVLFAGDRFATSRGVTSDGRKIYSLADAYAQATACTYFSHYEGFGNVFLECIQARRPIFVNAYEPVFWPDIGSKGFRTVMIRDGRLTPEAVEEIRQVLWDPALQKAMTDRNFEIGARHFSFEALQHTLSTLFSDAKKVNHAVSL